MTTAPRTSDFYDRSLITAYLPANIVPFINGRMLFNKHLGFAEPVSRLRAGADAKFLKTEQRFLRALSQALGSGALRPQCALQFFRADSEGDTLNLYSAGNANPAASFAFPRITGSPACLADLAPQKSSGETADAALFVATAGTGYAAEAARLAGAGEYVASHLLNIAAITCAEALAEAAQQIAGSSAKSGFFDFGAVMAITAGPAETVGELPPPGPGARYSFGYPLCPDLSCQRTLFALLNPRDIGVTLTESFMMEPEASVSGLIFPAASPRGRKRSNA
ncbi:MAG: vitamin B12 dependent-methionine synthase activation domain-containing protein [Elusimicrobiaceae bacterium]|nr:vitamin B12 dependent-methionine synthase activation domain-containing protein [Elusimicrobiaceae bacterium]